MRVEELDKEGKIIGFQNDFNINCNINANYSAVISDSRLIASVNQFNLKYLLITCVNIFINKNKKFYKLLKRLKRIDYVKYRENRKYN